MSAPVLDAVVVGGGPAGCSAAIHLAMRGARVALLEAQRYPHDKLCGEFLSPECAGMLDLLGMSERLAELGGVLIHSLKLTTADQNAWECRLPAPAINDQVLRPFGYFRIEVVLNHAVHGFGQPGFAGKLRAARGAHRTWIGHKNLRGKV